MADTRGTRGPGGDRRDARDGTQRAAQERQERTGHHPNRERMTTAKLISAHCPGHRLPDNSPQASKPGLNLALVSNRRARVRCRSRDRSLFGRLYSRRCKPAISPTLTLTELTARALDRARHAAPMIESRELSGRSRYRVVWHVPWSRCSVSIPLTCGARRLAGIHRSAVVARRAARLRSKPAMTPTVRFAWPTSHSTALSARRVSSGQARRRLSRRWVPLSAGAVVRSCVLGVVRSVSRRKVLVARGSAYDSAQLARLRSV